LGDREKEEFHPRSGTRRKRDTIVQLLGGKDAGVESFLSKGGFFAKKPEPGKEKRGEKRVIRL